MSENNMSGSLFGLELEKILYYNENFHTQGAAM